MRIVSGVEAQEYDVIVIGSGATGLTAALRAADAGARVSVLEKATVLGGTSALSGGMLWIPANGLPGASETDTAEARRYLERVTAGRADGRLLDCHLERGAALLKFLATSGGPEFDVVKGFPDYHAEFEGGRTGGRSIEPVPYRMGQLGALAQTVRPDPRPPFRQQEYFEYWNTYRNFPEELLREREREEIATRGRALVAPLLSALVARSVVCAVEAPAERLLLDGDRVSGVRVEGRAIRARQGVVLACGGFEWDERMCQQFLSGPLRARCGPPTNVGDAIRMGGAVGAALGNMNEAWWGVMAHIPGLEADGQALATMITVERSLPGSIVVNRAGRRFGNEATSYGTLGKTLAAFDAQRYDYANVPAFLIVDGRYMDRYGMFGVNDVSEAPEWLTVSDSLADLAQRLGIDAEELARTVERFNAHARVGTDPDFHRGEAAYDRYLGDAQAEHPNLAPLENPPFVALELTCGAFGTRGGIRTDEVGQALTPFDEPIPGLFAVGNNAAHPIAFGYMGAGATLGPGMTMAFAAGEAALER